MRVIHKLELALTGEQTFEMGVKDEIIKVAEQRGKLCVWYLTSMIMTTLTGPRHKRRFYIYGTGQEITCKREHYLATVPMSDGFVWHVYMRKQSN